jgi:DNA repair protein RecN (Recombination protein N)
MLTELRIENFAIIQNLELAFAPGLNIFTGETGAGKSIILDALEAVIGGKADTTSIRTGADRASVEATFSLPPGNRAAVEELLEREDLMDEGDTFLLSREVRREGRSTGRVNGRAVSLPVMRELGAYLIDIHGQSEHLSLLTVKSHLGLLDRYAGSQDHLAAYRTIYRELQSVRKDLAMLRESEQDALRRTDLLNFQVQEIEAAHLKEDEEDELVQERTRLANAENLANLAQQALNLLDESTPEAQSISDLSGQAAQALLSLSRIDASQAALAEQTQGLVDSMAEISRVLRAYLESIEFNPRRLTEVEERLELLHTLKRKYGADIPAVLDFAVNARKQLDMITHAGERIAELEIKETGLLEKLSAAARELSAKRSQAAAALGTAMERELGDLNMSGAGFAVDMQTEADEEGLTLADGSRVAFDENGVDKVEFLIAPNPGEGLKPLVKIASGGETSRLMLALKNVLAKADTIPTLIFDEIDQGIGGRVGFTVGEKLWRLGREHQVFCVTHLPQLAAFGDRHFRVRKEVVDERTLTLVDALPDAGRLEELALMLGGAGEANRQAAQETLQMARRRAGELLQ